MQEMAAAPYAQTMTQSQTLLETLDVCLCVIKKQ